MLVLTYKPVDSVVVGDILIQADTEEELKVVRIERLNKKTLRFYYAEDDHSDAPIKAMVATKNTTCRMFILPRRSDGEQAEARKEASA
jgi:hypothetical protein